MSKILQKKIITPLLLLLLFFISTAVFSSTADNKLKTVNKIDLDHLIEKTKTVKGKKYIIKPVMFSFDATIQTLPKKGNTDYIKQTLAMMGLRPIPEMSYQMFVRSQKGEVIAVYVEDKLAEQLLKTNKPEQRFLWQALHSYNYFRGPALVLMSYKKIQN